MPIPQLSCALSWLIPRCVSYISPWNCAPVFHCASWLCARLLPAIFPWHKANPMPFCSPQVMRTQVAWMVDFILLSYIWTDVPVLEESKMRHLLKTSPPPNTRSETTTSLFQAVSKCPRRNETRVQGRGIWTHQPQESTSPGWIRGLAAEAQWKQEEQLLSMKTVLIFGGLWGIFSPFSLTILFKLSKTYKVY